MIIDDEKVVGDMMKLFLEQEGYEVEVFREGDSAIGRLRDTEFDVVVTDLKMRGPDGFDILRKVKEVSPGTEVIMVTAFASLDVAVEARRFDVFDFFPKPVRMMDLKASIRKALEKRGRSCQGGGEPVNGGAVSCCCG
jgi:DNA-binding NtrC family response regulator